MNNPPRTISRLRGPVTATPAATSGSQTILESQAGPSATPSATLRLRAADPAEDSHVRWAADVVDNEGMGKKSSKVCCIYHKPKEAGESDSEDSDSSSSDGDSDGEPDLSRAQKAGGSGGRRGHHAHGEHRSKAKGPERKPSPNAYERQPRQQSKKN